MAINLHSKYATTIQTAYTTESLVAGRLSNDYSFSGVKTVKIVTPITVPMGDYVRTGSNRYGNPVEMQDTVQELTLTQDKSFSMTVDKGNNMDQNGVKAAGKMLALQLAERAIPLMDTYVFSVLSRKAGCIVGNATQLSEQNICARISEGTLHLDDHEVPQDNRTLFVSAAVYKLLNHSDEFMAVESLAKEAVAKGSVGRYDNMEVVKVPANRWPEHVNFMIVHRDAATAPVKLSDTRLHQDPPGISGNLLEGRQYYDCFVFAPKCEGVYVDVDTAEGKGSVVDTPQISLSSHLATITADSGVTFTYTTDGTDPRYSSSAMVYTSPVATTEGMVFKAFGEKEGNFPSAVASAADLG